MKNGTILTLYDNPVDEKFIFFKNILLFEVINLRASKTPTRQYCFAIEDSRQILRKYSKKSKSKKVLTNLPAFSILKNVGYLTKFEGR